MRAFKAERLKPTGRCYWCGNSVGERMVWCRNCKRKREQIMDKARRNAEDPNTCRICNDITHATYSLCPRCVRHHPEINPIVGAVNEKTKDRQVVNGIRMSTWLDDKHWADPNITKFQLEEIEARSQMVVAMALRERERKGFQ